MLNFPPAVKLWYCPEAVDMRLGFDGRCNAPSWIIAAQAYW